MSERTCAMCETHPAKWNEPASAAEPALAEAQAAALERRLEELERGVTTPAELHAQMLDMCAMCRGIVCDVVEGTSKECVKDRVRYCIARLRNDAVAVGPTGASASTKAA